MSSTNNMNSADELFATCWRWAIIGLVLVVFIVAGSCSTLSYIGFTQGYCQTALPGTDEVAWTKCQ